MTVTRTRAGLLAAVLCSALLGTIGGVAADQTDTQLPRLFADLVNAPNARSAHRVEQKIWSVWFANADPRALELLERARDTAQTGAIKQALGMFNQLVDQFPAYAEGWNQRAIMRFLSGDIGGSLDDIERTLELEPRHFGALSGRGQCYLQQERFAEALAAFERARDLNPWVESTARQIEMLKSLLQQGQTPI